MVLYVNMFDRLWLILIGFLAKAIADWLSQHILKLLWSPLI